MSLPPGTTGFPLIGETLSFLGDSFGFISSRVEEHGNIFRTSLLGHPTVFLTGPEACEVWLDTDLVQRAGSFPANIEQLFGGKSLPLLDGDDHRARKEIVMAAFSRSALSAYVPILEKTLRDTLDGWADLESQAGGGSVVAIPGLKRLAVEGIARSVFGASDEALVAELTDGYQKVAAGFTGLPIRFPGTAFHAALAARDAIFERLRELIRARRAKPGDDGISRVLAKKAFDGRMIDDEDLVLELHHMMLAGLIIFAELAFTIGALTDEPTVLARLRDELAASGKTRDYTLEDLAKRPHLLRVVMEVKRACPNVPVSFGKARKEFTFSGYTVPEGTMVFMAAFQNNLSAAFRDPHRFDPDRFAPPREEHLTKNAYVPQGAGETSGHKCAGYDLSTVFMQLFTAILVTDYTWELPVQDRSLSYASIPPEPKSGLLVRLQRKRS